MSLVWSGDREMHTSAPSRSVFGHLRRRSHLPRLEIGPEDRRTLRIKGVVDSAPPGVEDGDLWRVDIDGRMRGVMRYTNGRSKWHVCSQTAESATPRTRTSLALLSFHLPTLDLIQDDAVGH